jgi:hypothetical protein
VSCIVRKLLDGKQVLISSIDGRSGARQHTRNHRNRKDKLSGPPPEVSQSLNYVRPCIGGARQCSGNLVPMLYNSRETECAGIVDEPEQVTYLSKQFETQRTFRDFGFVFQD